MQSNMLRDFILIVGMIFLILAGVAVFASLFLFFLPLILVGAILVAIFGRKSGRRQYQAYRAARPQEQQAQQQQHPSMEIPASMDTIDVQAVEIHDDDEKKS